MKGGGMNEYTRTLEDKIVDLLKEHGVSNYLLSLKDPDDNKTVFRVNGSDFWIYGVAKNVCTRYEHEWCLDIKEERNRDE